MDELADLANSEGKQFWGNVKRFHEKLYNLSINSYSNDLIDDK